MSSPKFPSTDALIIGGGPAGLSAAIVLAEQGLRVLLCEQKPFPVDKACGEGIMPTGVAHLEQLGIRPYLPTDDYSLISGIRYISATGRTAAATFAEGPGWGLTRLTLSTALHRRAADFPNLTICPGAHAKPLHRTPNAITVLIGRTPITTRLLIAADGLNSPTRRWAGLDSRANWQFAQPARATLPFVRQNPWQRWGVRQHYPIPPWTNHVEVHWQNGLEAYITPAGRSLTNIAFLWDRQRYTPTTGGKSLFPSLLANFSSLHERLAHIPPADTPRAIGPLHHPVSNPVADGVLLIGDAAGYLDAITGEGISLATAAAHSLAQTVAPLLKQKPGILTAQDLSAYARAYHQITRPYYQLTHLVLWISRYPAIREWVISTLGRDPTLFQHLLSANMGLASPWSPAVLLRFLRSLLP